MDSDGEVSSGNNPSSSSGRRIAKLPPAAGAAAPADSNRGVQRASQSRGRVAAPKAPKAGQDRRQQLNEFFGCVRNAIESHRGFLNMQYETLTALVTRSCDMYHDLYGRAEDEQDDDATKGAETKVLRNRLVNSMRLLYYMEKAASAARIAKNLIAVGPDATSVEIAPEEHAAGLAPFCKMDLIDDKINKFQTLLLYLLNCIYHFGYRRSGADCCRRLYTPEGYNTHAWIPACSVRDFVYDMTRKETNFDQWKNLTDGKTTAANVADYLCACRDAQFPDLVKNRAIFSFRNGIYNARLDRFFAYAGAAAAGGTADDGTTAIPAEYVASKYFDLDFDASPVSDWYQVPTPFLQSILDYQNFSEDVCRWMYVMLGRLLYDLNDLDHWQVIPYLKGQASSGKSTILLQVCRNFYDSADVGVLSNGMERKFGAGAFSDKYLFVAPEIKSDFRMDQAEFQSMVSGEAMSIAVKFQMARSQQWRVPGIMAGNQVPGWVDNSGSITRRIVLFNFERKVEDGDMELGKKLANEMAAIIRKCNLAYLWAVRNYASKNIWRQLPEYFQQTREDLKESTNLLEHLLKSGKLTISPELRMPWETFVMALKDHAIQNNFKVPTSFTRDYYAGAFLSHNLKKTTRKETHEYRGRPCTIIWLEGADFSATDY